jgi:hypothetical protein
MPSPGRPKITSTPQSIKRSTSMSEAFMLSFFRLESGLSWMRLEGITAEFSGTALTESFPCGYSLHLIWAAAWRR